MFLSASIHFELTTLYYYMVIKTCSILCSPESSEVVEGTVWIETIRILGIHTNFSVEKFTEKKAYLKLGKEKLKYILR